MGFGGCEREGLVIVGYIIILYQYSTVFQGKVLNFPAPKLLSLLPFMKMMVVDIIKSKVGHGIDRLWQSHTYMYSVLCSGIQESLQNFGGLIIYSTQLCCNHHFRELSCDAVFQ